MQKRIKLTLAVTLTLATTGMSHGQSPQEMMDVGQLIYWAEYCKLTPSADVDRKIKNAMASAEGDGNASMAVGAGFATAQQQIFDAEAQGRDFCSETARELKGSRFAGKVFVEW